MKSQQLLFVASALTFFQLLQDASAIRCYSCNSLIDPNCGDPFTVHFVATVNCNDDYYRDYPNMAPNMCKKVHRKTSDGRVIERSCVTPEDISYSPAEGPTSYTDDTNGLVYRCKNELCNTAVALKTTATLAIFIVFISWIL